MRMIAKLRFCTNLIHKLTLIREYISRAIGSIFVSLLLQIFIPVAFRCSVK